MEKGPQEKGLWVELLASALGAIGFYRYGTLTEALVPQHRKCLWAGAPNALITLFNTKTVMKWYSDRKAMLSVRPGTSTESWTKCPPPENKWQITFLLCSFSITSEMQDVVCGIFSDHLVLPKISKTRLSSWHSESAKSNMILVYSRTFLPFTRNPILSWDCTLLRREFGRSFV